MVKDPQSVNKMQNEPQVSVQVISMFVLRPQVQRCVGKCRLTFVRPYLHPAVGFLCTVLTQKVLFLV